MFRLLVLLVYSTGSSLPAWTLLDPHFLCSCLVATGSSVQSGG